MKVKSIFLFCACLVPIACTKQTYEKDDVIAILNGEEMKAIDIMLQYLLG